MKASLRILIGLLSAGTLWGVVIEPRMIDETFEEARIPNLQFVWEGKQIAVIADFQIGMWLGNTDTVRRVMERLLERRPAAVLIAGDFIYHPTEDDSVKEAREEFDSDEQERAEELIDEAVELVTPLVSAGIPTFAVLGNHDYAMGTESARSFPVVARVLEERLERAGVQILNNESTQVRLSEGQEEGNLRIVGIGPRYPKQDRVADALKSVSSGEPRVVLMHNPETFKDIPEGAAPLAVAAHTHGGQIRIPFLPRWSWMNIVKEREIDGDGWVKPQQSTGENALYVNRGIGFSVIPVRINCPPEITYFKLQRKR